ncbi:MAG: GTPase ObgE [Actinomycetota bacterium]|nr:GTPase ObgE [Actinomycetota bacterium]
MSAFVDEAQLHAKAGDGGAGAVAFRREAHVDRGGPEGGEGGRGGDVWLVASSNVSSLLGFRDHPHRRAGNGTHGAGKKRHGARGADLDVPVPVGTRVRDGAGAIVADLASAGDRWLAAEGGRGGRGNARFLSNRRRAPSFAEQGEPGEEHWYDLDLALVADVALVGFPNVGKSTLISRISAARPKIADYPFTTLEPNLGVVRTGETDLVVADVPGLVEGAADGRGLGHRFLRHVTRARVLVVMLDLSPAAPADPADQERVLLDELGRYEPELLRRPRVMVGSKADVADPADGARPASVVLEISSVTGRGVDQLVGILAERVQTARQAAASTSAGTVLHRPEASGFTVVAVGPGHFEVEGRSARRAVAVSDLTSDEAASFVAGRLARMGVDRALARAGARDGDLVTIGDLTFTWHRDQAEYTGEPPARRRSRA